MFDTSTNPHARVNNVRRAIRALLDPPHQPLQRLTDDVRWLEANEAGAKASVKEHAERQQLQRERDRDQWAKADADPARPRSPGGAAPPVPPGGRLPRGANVPAPSDVPLHIQWDRRADAAARIYAEIVDQDGGGPLMMFEKAARAWPVTANDDFEPLELLREQCCSASCDAALTFVLTVKHKTDEEKARATGPIARYRDALATLQKFVRSLPPMKMLDDLPIYAERLRTAAAELGLPPPIEIRALLTEELPAVYRASTNRPRAGARELLTRGGVPPPRLGEQTGPQVLPPGVGPNEMPKVIAVDGLPLEERWYEDPDAVQLPPDVHFVGIVLAMPSGPARIVPLREEQLIEGEWLVTENIYPRRWSESRRFSKFSEGEYQLGWGGYDGPEYSFEAMAKQWDKHLRTLTGSSAPTPIKSPSPVSPPATAFARAVRADPDDDRHQPPVAVTPESERFVFRRDGQFWRACFRRSETAVKDCKAMAYIAALLRNPNPVKPVPAVDLVGMDVQAVPAQEAGQAVADQDAIKEYREEIEDCRRELAAAERNNDEAAIEAARRELDKLTLQVGRMVGLGGRPRQFGARDAGRTAASQVRANLTTAYRNLEKAGANDLAAHLQEFIKAEGNAYAYRPGPTPPLWQL